MKAVVERVAALETLIPKVQEDLQEEMRLHFKSVMDKIGELSESVLSGSRASSILLPPSSPTLSDTSPTKERVHISTDSEEDTFYEDVVEHGKSMEEAQDAVLVEFPEAQQTVEETVEVADKHGEHTVAGMLY